MKDLEEINISLERHEQQLRTLERDVGSLKEIQSEIRTMSESLVTITTELKHTNEQLAKNEAKIDEINNTPKERLQHIFVAIVSAIAGALISTAIALIVA